MTTEKIQLSDKSTIEVSLFPSSGKSYYTLVCLPAMGVRATYYRKFAEYLQNQGFNVITTDWRGHGKSSVKASNNSNFGYEDLIQDLNILHGYAKGWFPNTNMIIVGHSLGGQIGSLFTSKYSEKVSGLILITSCSVYYKGWSGWTAWKLRLAGLTFYPVSKMLGYFPGSIIGFGGREAKKVMKDWSHNALYGKYKPTNSSFDYETGLGKVCKSVLSISIENDNLASKEAVKNLYKKFSVESNITHLHLTSKEAGIDHLNHFNWAKQPSYFGNIITDWINEEKPTINREY